jgi:hypothetical protein
MGIYRGFDKLKPEFLLRLQAGLNELDRKGITYAIIETYRAQEVQDAYYAQGRESLDIVNQKRIEAGISIIDEYQNRHIITKARHSKHTDGLAADIVPVISNGRIPWLIRDASTAALWLSISEVMKKHGLAWGGDWEPKNEWGIGWDPAHYEI